MMIGVRHSRRLRLTVMEMTISLLLLAAAAAAAPAIAHATAPRWRLESRIAPTSLQPEREGQIVMAATDAGEGEVNGEK